jgi:deazaflavin-dependent oxidoreductase (nitroreductase family)
MNRYERLVARFGKTRLFPSFGRYVLTPLDRRLQRRSVHLTTLGTSFPLCYLTSTGRHSGEPRTTPLLVIDGPAGWMVAATNFGGRQPAWALNLRHDARARLERDGVAHPVTARLATDEEKADSWDLFDAAWPAFADYCDRVDRPVDVFILEPDE